LLMLSRSQIARIYYCASPIGILGDKTPEILIRRTIHTIVNTLAHQDMRMRLIPSVNARFWIVNGLSLKHISEPTR
ncbi:hypothetical protein, partial [Salmonella enterica]|uniref:hypothetical protein n=1 Tax=Salmonella enterica TaxID=28901 RepID=UPI001C3E9BDF